MDAALTRDTLQRLLVEENGALAEFERLLDEEHGALRSRNIDALEQLAESRQANVIRLLKIEDERRSLCSMLGFDTDLHGAVEDDRLVRPGTLRSRSGTRNARRVRRIAVRSMTVTGSSSARRSSVSKGCWVR